MHAYHYRAVSITGSITQGQMTAADEQAVHDHVRQSGMELITLRRKTNYSAFLPSLPKRHHAASLLALESFSTHMRDMVRAGVPFIEALRSAIAACEAGTMRDSLNIIERAVGEGQSITQAFSEHSRVFPPLYQALLAAGLASGDLVTTFDHLVRYANSRAATQRHIRRALRYPLFLLVIVSGVTTFMMSMVVPAITQFLRTLDGTLPWTTRALIALSDSITALGWLVPVLAIIGGMALILARRLSTRWARPCDAALLRLPIIGTLIQRLALARFMQSLALLCHSNLGILASLREARGTLGNRALDNAWRDAEEQVRSGLSLSQAAAALVPPAFLRLIRAGEVSGQLTASLNDCATIAARELQESIDAFLALLEPALTILMGLMLAWIVIAVLGPVYNSLSLLNNAGAP